MLFRFPAAAILVAAALGAAPATAAKPDQVVVFGDSLVDPGNISIATGGATPSAAAGYYQGRFTNGPDYTDLLDQRLYGHYSVPYLAGGNNYAFGGASIVTSNYPVPNLTTQLGFYTATHTVDPNALYIINLGANDVFAIDSGAVAAASVPTYDTLAANTLAGAVEYLSAHGATKILVTGVPVADAAGVALDTQIENRLDQIAPTLTGTTLDRFSYFNFFSALARDPAQFGVAAFSHLPSDGCFSNPAAVAAGCSGYFSVDGTHPIAPIQAAIFRAVAHDVGIGAVPEPVSWALMVAGFGLVGAAVRRRRAAAVIAG